MNRESFELLLKRLRRSIDINACFSLMLAQSSSVRKPEYARLTKRFFEDVKAIVHLIERNKKTDPHHVLLCVYGRRGSGNSMDRTSILLTKLRDVQAEIENFVSDYRPIRRGGGNREPLSYNFISEMLDVWREFSDFPTEQAAAERAYLESGRDIPKLFRSEYRPFARLLGAAWRDVGFPLVDHKNESREPLEGWFVDRVRKHFVDPGSPADEF